MQSTQTNAEFEVVTEVERFISLQQEWDELWAAARGTPFQLFRYCLHALREVAIPAGAGLHCIIGRKGGRMVFAWPLIRSRDYLWMTMRPLAPDRTEPSDMLVMYGEDTEALICAGWRALLDSCGGDIIHLPRVRTESALHRYASESKWLSRAEPHIIGMARLRQYRNWADYRSTLAESVRKEQDYHQRRLERTGETAVFISDLDDSRSAAYVQTLLEWKREWSERVGAGGEFFKEPYQNFLRKLSADPSFGHSFRLFVLALNGKAIAVSLVAMANHTVIGMQAAYDPAHAKCSPGALLLEHILKWAFENQCDVDFGSGESKYKSNWTGGHGYACVDFRIAVSRWGQTAFAARALQRQYEGLRLRIAATATGRSGRPSKTRSDKHDKKDDQSLGPSTHGT
jgi:CelD/BcsL family acetyltransferase involved in cellulose biosynthesis